MATTFFSRDAATLYERVSLRPLVRPSVTLSFFGRLGATNAVYTAPLLVLSPPSSSPSPSNTFFLHRHNFFSSCIAEIRRSFDSNGLLRSEFALILYFNKLAISADWLAGLAEERAALGWRVF